MTFPSTPIQANFSLMSDHGPPITGFLNPSGVLASYGRMIVDTMLAQADSTNPNSPLGFALLDEIFGPSYEAYVQVGPLDPEGNFGGLAMVNQAETSGYIVMWTSDGIETGLTAASIDDNDGLVSLRSWSIDNLSENDWVGFHAKSGKMTIYLRYGSGVWEPLGTVSGLTLPATGRVGFGAIGVG